MKKFVLNSVLLVGYFFCNSNVIAEASNLVDSLQVLSQSPVTKLILTTKLKPTYRLTESSNKVIIEFDNTEITDNCQKLEFDRTIIKEIEISRKGKKLKLTLDLEIKVIVRHLVLSNPNRVVIEIVPIKDQGLSEEKLDELGKKIMEVAYVNFNNPVSEKSLSWVIVIDPGHGGKDPGALGGKGAKEKDITLAVAQKLQKIINQKPGFKAYLTRERDYLISLANRLKLARKYRADLFVSIHVDASYNQSTSGVSVFVISKKGTASIADKWLNRKENKTELARVIHGKNDAVRLALIDLAQNAAVGTSIGVGKRILAELSGSFLLYSPQVQPAEFLALKPPEIPSLLIELGFISNQREELKLVDEHYQHALAIKIASGIEKYFRLDHVKGY